MVVTSSPERLADMGGERILVLDDEADMVDNCRRILSRDGYQCQTTTDPREALQVIEPDRPDLLPGKSNNPVLGGPDKYFDTSSFALQEAGFQGNLGRNTLIGPGLFNVDFSLFKQSALTERLGLQFRFETFNIFNHANFALPSTSLFDRQGRALPDTGRISGTVTPARQLQFGLRLSW